MTSDESSELTQQAIDPGKNQPGVLCGHCDHVNHGALTECEVCGSQLYTKCSHCGLQAPRVYTRCPKCRHRLRGHIGLSRRSRDKLRRTPSSSDKANRQLIWAAAAVLVLIVIATFFVMRYKG
ncbi:MAG TPA: hypothetical protein PKM43_04195 [Verrucomicrobiota bacterium]|nr:hypothetical protein [Verrucomicrobiota bacterium]HRZ34815.1 hypothetical protein [Candidatus Paceibacterota bacterium]